MDGARQWTQDLSKMTQCTSSTHDMGWVLSVELFGAVCDKSGLCSAQETLKVDVNSAVLFVLVCTRRHICLQS